MRAFPGLVGTAEIAYMLNVSRQRAQQLTGHRSFPEPVAVLRAGKIWLEDEVAEWAHKRGRELRPLPDDWWPNGSSTV